MHPRRRGARRRWRLRNASYRASTVVKNRVTCVLYYYICIEKFIIITLCNVIVLHYEYYVLTRHIHNCQFYILKLFKYLKYFHFILLFI
jgi:hypothetical protein